MKEAIDLKQSGYGARISKNSFILAVCKHSTCTYWDASSRIFTAISSQFSCFCTYEHSFLKVQSSAVLLLPTHASKEQKERSCKPSGIRNTKLQPLLLITLLSDDQFEVLVERRQHQSVRQPP